jgi:hypothetical protein
MLPLDANDATQLKYAVTKARDYLLVDLNNPTRTLIACRYVFFSVYLFGFFILISYD